MTLEELLKGALVQIAEVIVPVKDQPIVKLAADIADTALRAGEGKISVPDAQAEIQRLTDKFKADDAFADAYAKAQLEDTRDPRPAPAEDPPPLPPPGDDSGA